MKLYCCGCSSDVEARLTDGEEIYPHRKDLYSLPFWRCDTCDNFVGCHHKTKNRTKPLGCIPTPEIKKARSSIHNVLDPIWHHGLADRSAIYKMISKKIGWSYHTAKIRSIEEAREIYKIIEQIKVELKMKQIPAWQAEDSAKFFEKAECERHEKLQLFEHWYDYNAKQFQSSRDVAALHDFIQHNAEAIRGFLPPVAAKPELDIGILKRYEWYDSDGDVAVSIINVKKWLAGELK